MTPETKSWLIAEMVKSRMKLRFHPFTRPTFSDGANAELCKFILNRMKVGFWEWQMIKFKSK